MPPDDPRDHTHATRPRAIAVRVAGSLYGLKVDEVQEVIGMRPLTRVFHAPEVIAGVTNLRGDVLAVIDLPVLLGGEPSVAAADPDNRIVVVREPSGSKRRAGLRVDGLAGLRDIPDDGLEETPSTASDEVKALVEGVIATPPACSVLSVASILDTPALAELSGGKGQDS